MAAKIHRFPFQFKLPSELPVSFEGTYGYIRYNLTGTIESRLNQPNGVFTLPITVLKTITPNDPELQVNSFVAIFFKPKARKTGCSKLHKYCAAFHLIFQLILA